MDCDNDVCACRFTWQTSGPTCSDWSATTWLYVLTRALICVVYLAVLIYALHVLRQRYLVSRLSKDRFCTCNFTMSTLLFMICSCVSGAIYEFARVGRACSWGMVGAEPGTGIYWFRDEQARNAQTVVRTALFVLESFTNTTATLCFLNVGLMWVDICLATHRLQPADFSSLRATRRYLIGYATGVVVLTLVFIVMMVVSTIYPWFFGVSS